MYQYNQEVVEIEEIAEGNDIEFHIKLLKKDPFVQGMKQIQKQFDENDISTDVLFYTYLNCEYRVIVRQDYYVDFILALMKHHLVESVEWQE